MEYGTKFAKVTVEGGSTKQFSAVVNAKSFSIITDGIYKNKILAVLRELSANALDAHKEAGNKDKPFDIHLPRKDEEYFYIRDYGTGISPEKMEDVYTKFFVSSKDTSNEYTGCLGIGKGVGFCYNTKSFTVESYFNGVRVVYTCFVDGDGIPSIAKLMEETTNEPNGLRIQLAVPAYDFHAFESEAQLYKWFDVKPNFIGRQITLEQQNKVVENDTFYCLESGDCVAVMGSIAYPIEIGHEALKEFKYIIDSPMVFNFDIGELDPSSSRESLSYTQKTISKIRKRFKEAIESIENLINTKLKECKNGYQAAKLYHELMKTLFYFPVKHYIKSDKLLWNGKPIETRITTKIFIAKDKDGLDLWEDMQTTIYENRYGVAKNPRLATIVNTEYPVIYNDLKRGEISRCKLYCKNLKKNIQLISGNKELIKKTLDCFDSDLILASSLPKPVYNNTGNTRNKMLDIAQVFNHHRVSECWKAPNGKIEGVYIIRKGYYALSESGSLEHPSQYAELCKKLGINLYGAIASEEKELIKLGLVNLHSLILQKRKENEDFIEKNKDIYIDEKAYGEISFAISYKGAYSVSCNCLPKVISQHKIKAQDAHTIYNNILFDKIDLNRLLSGKDFRSIYFTEIQNKIIQIKNEIKPFINVNVTELIQKYFQELDNVSS